VSEAAAEAAADLVAGAARLAEAPPEGEQPDPEATAVELPEFEADLTGIEDILEEAPDDDEDEPAPPVAEEETYDEYDPDQLQKKLKAWRRRTLGSRSSGSRRGSRTGRPKRHAGFRWRMWRRSKPRHGVGF
jgi:hypothetical protein